MLPQSRPIQTICPDCRAGGGGLGQQLVAHTAFYPEDVAQVGRCRLKAGGNGGGIPAEVRA